jgi:hypothetical protein
VDEVDRGHAVARGQHAVERRGSAAALGVAEVDAARLVAGALLDLLRQRLADAAEPRVPEGVELGLPPRTALDMRAASRPRRPRRWRNFLPLSQRAFRSRHDVVDVDLFFRRQGNVRAAGDPGRDGDPSGVAAHDFDHLHAAVRLGGRVQPVDRLGGNHHRGVEAEARVGAAEVVVDGLGHADAVHAALGQFHRDRLGIVAAHRDQGVQLLSWITFRHCSKPPGIFFTLVREDFRMVPPRCRIPLVVSSVRGMVRRPARRASPA